MLLDNGNYYSYFEKEILIVDSNETEITFSPLLRNANLTRHECVKVSTIVCVCAGSPKTHIKATLFDITKRLIYLLFSLFVEIVTHTIENRIVYAACAIRYALIYIFMIKCAITKEIILQ